MASRVYCVDSATATIHWTFPDGGGLSAPAIANNRLYIGSGNTPLFYCLDANAGKPLWIYKFGQRVEESTLCIYRDKVFILAGVTPMKSVGMARYMQLKVPGMDVPNEIIKRLQGAGKGKVAAEGIKIACEQIEEFKEMKGVHGVHLMAIEWEHKVPEIAEQAKVLPRPTVE